MHYREIYARYRASRKEKMDVHTRLMKNYEDIPSWWFHVLLAVTLLVSLSLTVFMKKDIQMPYWGLIFAAFLAFMFTLPISIITATTNQVIYNSVSYSMSHRFVRITFVLETSCACLCLDTGSEYHH